jgi:hypothetical protein
MTSVTDYWRYTIGQAPNLTRSQRVTLWALVMGGAIERMMELYREWTGREPEKEG